MLVVDVCNASDNCAIIQQWQSYVLIGEITIRVTEKNVHFVFLKHLLK